MSPPVCVQTFHMLHIRVEAVACGGEHTLAITQQGVGTHHKVHATHLKLHTTHLKLHTTHTSGWRLWPVGENTPLPSHNKG